MHEPGVAEEPGQRQVPWQPETWITTLCIGFLVAMGYWLQGKSIVLGRLDHPIATAIRTHEQTLDAGAAPRGVLTGPSAFDGEQPDLVRLRKEVAKNYREVLEAIDAGRATADSDALATALMARLAIVEAVTGRPQQAEALVQRLREQANVPRMAGALGRFISAKGSAADLRAELPTEEAARVVLSGGNSALEGGYTAEKFVTWLHASQGRSELATRTRESHWRRGRFLSTLEWAVGGFRVLLVLLGVLAVWRLRHFAKAAPAPAPWSERDGWAVIVRAAVLAGPALIIWALLSDLVIGNSMGLGTLVAALPFLLLVKRHLLPPGASLVSHYELRPSRPMRRAVGAYTVALIGLSQVSILVLTGVSAWLDVSEFWFEGASEDLLWGGWGDVAQFVVGGVIMAPALEEIAFRGIAYQTLRLRFGPWPAAIITAVLFSVAHGYSAVPFLMLGMNAVLASWTYERTGSLLPAIVEHAFHNFLAIVMTLSLRL